MAIFSPYICKQFLDNNGDPLDAGYLVSKVAGTPNDKDTFTDSTGDTENANPLVFSAAGRLTFWLTTGLYDFFIYDSDDVLIDQELNVPGGASASNYAIVENIAALRALASGEYDYVSTGGYTSKGDNGASDYYWSSTSTAADDDGLVIQPDSAPTTGRWLLQNGGILNETQLNGSDKVLTNIPLQMGHEFRFGTALDAGTGYTDITAARAAQISVSGYTHISVLPNGASDETYSFSGMTSGNLYVITNDESNIAAIIDGGASAPTDITIQALEGQLCFYYDSPISGSILIAI